MGYVPSVEVGDAALQLNGLNNSRIISRSPKEASRVILETLSDSYTDNTREMLASKLDFESCNKKIIDLYKRILVKKKIRK